MRTALFNGMSMKLLTTANAKTIHGESLGILTGILYLSPETSAKLCPYASEECKALCLVNSGRAEIFPMVNKARARKTLEFLSDRSAFVETLRKDIQALERKAQRENMRAAVRLNGTSDILWEKLTPLMEEFPAVQFYDYTKVPLKYRATRNNYHLTFSFSGHNWMECESALAHGTNVAMVFDKLPKAHRGYRVIDGTIHDVRFLDGAQGVIVGLCAKGKRARTAAKAGSAFIVKADPQEAKHNDND